MFDLSLVIMVEQDDNWKSSSADLRIEGEISDLKILKFINVAARKLKDGSGNDECYGSTSQWINCHQILILP